MSSSPTLESLFGLRGRTALVTGGSSGIGRGIAGALAGAGARVLIAARTQSAIDEAVAEIRADGGTAEGLRADLSTRAGAHALADVAGEVDILVSCAGINLRPPMSELDEPTWDATMAVNLDAPFVLGQRLAPGMAERGYGRLIHISSQQAHRPFGNSGAYGVSKAAVEGLARVQAEAWSSRGGHRERADPGLRAHAPEPRDDLRSGSHRRPRGPDRCRPERIA
ncbi:SDR family NAD(P)-dependent oxidoreductase [Brachybacterium tyrofermentans]|uniref:SDR family NAD(P)-dependent oxidoreductase n=1 Tax=Brachybacterium tyrofermentans TaxID=47848 RepID=UPI003FD219B9